MPRIGTIARHPKREEIAKAITGGQLSEREIAKQYGITKDAVAAFKHAIGHQSTTLEIARRYIDADTITHQLESWMRTVQKVVDACDRYLSDPEHPDQYDLGPRPFDINVIYETEEDVESPGDPDDEDSHVKVTRRKVRKKAMLSELLAGVPNVFSVSWKTADPRELILKAVMAGKAQLEMIANIIGVLKAQTPAGPTNIQINILETMPMVAAVLSRHPSVLSEVVAALGEQ